MPFFPSGSSANGQTTFFFLNHPINFVVVTARCMGFMKKTDSFWLAEVEDGTGSELKLALFKVVPDKLMEQFTDKIIEIKGYIRETKMYGRQVNALDIRVVGDGIVELALAPVDALEVRGHVLGVAWSLDENVPKAELKSAMPMEYCSLIRTPSSLQGSKLFEAKRKEFETFNSKRPYIHNEPSLLEKLGVDVPWRQQAERNLSGSSDGTGEQQRAICLPGTDPDIMEDLDRMFDKHPLVKTYITIDMSRGMLMSIKSTSLEESDNKLGVVNDLMTVGPTLTISSMAPSVEEMLEQVQENKGVSIQLNTETGQLIGVSRG